MLHVDRNNELCGDVHSHNARVRMMQAERARAEKRYAHALTYLTQAREFADDVSDEYDRERLRADVAHARMGVLRMLDWG